MEKLFDYFQSQHFSEKESQKIGDSFSKKTFKKGDFFVEEGKTCRYLGFVESGFLQYFILVEGEEKTSKSIPSWLSVFGIISCCIYLLAQAKLFAKVIPTFLKVEAHTCNPFIDIPTTDQKK